MKTEFRQTWRQAVPIGLLAGLLVLLWYRDLDGLPVVVATAFGGTLGIRQGRVTIDAGGVTLRRFTSRTIPWSEVESVDRVRVLGGESVRLRVDGRPVALAAPVHTPVLAPDPAFEEKAVAIERQWHAARGGGDA